MLSSGFVIFLLCIVNIYEPSKARSHGGFHSHFATCLPGV